MNWKPANDVAYQQLRIEEVIEEGPDVKTLILGASQPVPYEAGQFLTFVFKGAQGEERRSYSMSSSPDAAEPLAITLKRVPNGKYSRPLIDSARVGDILATTGAAGQFVLPENIDHYKQVFLFAAGIGITPLYSLLKTLLIRHPAIQVVLVYSNPSAKQTVFYKQLLTWYDRFPRQLKIEFLFSSAADLRRARLSKWLLPQLLEEYAIGSPHERLFFACGPFAYMRMVAIALEESGYDSSQFKKENFDTSMPVYRVQPPDQEMHQVRLLLNDRAVNLSVQYPITILQAAKQQRIPLPYSCETGRCGSCVMQCVAGKVWMSYNEVLTEREIADGKVLTCVAYPIGGDVVLE
jgi:ferredoxin-NADP reductase